MGCSVPQFQPSRDGLTVTRGRHWLYRPSGKNEPQWAYIATIGTDSLPCPAWHCVRVVSMGGVVRRQIISVKLSQGDAATEKKMGLFSSKSKLNSEHMAKLVGLANQAWGFFPGSLNGAVLTYKDVQIDFLSEHDRQRFDRELIRVFETYSGEPRPLTKWVEIYNANSADPDRFVIASLLVAKAVMLIDVIAEAELQFPKDRRIKSLRLQLMTQILSSLERYYGDRITSELVQFLPHVEKLLVGPLADDWAE